jgi:hypothetical protein
VPRYIAAYCVWKSAGPGTTNRDIGLAFGQDHSFMSLVIKRVEERMAADEEYRETVSIVMGRCRQMGVAA